MDNLEIFDKNGNPLNVADVIYGFIKGRAEGNKIDIEDVYIGVDVGFPEGKAPIWISTYQSVDTGYDSMNLNEFGDPVKVGP